MYTLENELPKDWSYVTNSVSVNNNQYLRFSQPAVKKIRKRNKKKAAKSETSIGTEMNVYDYLNDVCDKVTLMEMKRAELICKAQEIDLAKTLEVLTLETILKKVRIQHIICQLESIINGTDNSTSTNDELEPTSDTEDTNDSHSDSESDLSLLPVELEVVDAESVAKKDNVDSSQLEERKILENVGEVTAFRVKTSDSDDSLRLCFFHIYPPAVPSLLLDDIDSNELSDKEFALVLGENTKDNPEEEKYKLEYRREEMLFETANVPEVNVTVDPYRAVPSKQELLLKALVSASKAIICNCDRVTTLLSVFLQSIHTRNNSRYANFRNVDFALSKNQFEALLGILPVNELYIDSPHRPIPLLDDNTAFLLPPTFSIEAGRLTACIGLTDATIRHWYHQVPKILQLRNIKGSFTVEAICKLIEIALTKPSIITKEFSYCFTLSANDRACLKSFVESNFETKNEGRQIIIVINKETGRSMKLFSYKLEYDMELEAYKTAQFKDFVARSRRGQIGNSNHDPFAFVPAPGPYHEFF